MYLGQRGCRGGGTYNRGKAPRESRVVMIASTFNSVYVFCAQAFKSQFIHWVSTTDIAVFHLLLLLKVNHQTCAQALFSAPSESKMTPECEEDVTSS